MDATTQYAVLFAAGLAVVGLLAAFVRFCDRV